MAILALQATAGIEILRQHSSIVAARHQAMNSHAARPPLDAIFLPVGGGSLLAGVAAAVKQLHPAVKVIGVEPESVDVLRQSLMSGSRVTIEEPGVDGIWVPQLGEEVRCMHAPLTYTPSDTHTHTHTHTHIYICMHMHTHIIYIFRSTGCATPWWTMWSASRTMRSARPSEIASKTRAPCSSPQALYLLWLYLLWLCLLRPPFFLHARAA